MRTRPIVVFDLDGTLADCEHRKPFIDSTDEGWRRFFAACSHDKPIWHVIQVMDALRDAGHEVEIWSGRSDEVEAMTRAWMRRTAHIDPTLLTFMRESGDRRDDVELKRGFLHKAAKLGKRPAMVFDDRDSVVAMWRAEGIPCFQVAPGAF